MLDAQVGLSASLPHPSFLPTGNHNMAKTTPYGSADIPLAAESGHNDDCLDMHRYAEALARFVLDCETPMTVGIQGEWGSGKTSLMRMMHTPLRRASLKNLLIFDFETWQYGAVGRDSELGFLLMRSILRKMQESADESVLFKISRMIARIAPILARAGTEAATNIASFGGVDGKTLSNELFAPESRDSSAELSAIRSGFAQLIFELTGGKKGKGRAIIFVDDLDRIHPERAVALMEVMKNFMDVPRCIYVLACDYEVVRRGVAHRLGISETDKAEAFFHKIIQVPFSMPTHSYKVSQLVDRFVKRRVADARLKRDPKSVAHMIESAIGTNPRSIKRFLNRVDLHSCLHAGASESQTAEDIAGLMALVAMQMRWPRVAAHVAQQRSAVEMEALLIQLRELSTDGVQESDDLVEVLKHEFVVKKPDTWRNHPDLPRFQRFVDDLWDCLDTSDHDARLSADELAGLLRHATGISMTSVETSESRKEEREQAESGGHNEIEDQSARAIIQNLLTTERRRLRYLQMVNNGNYFQLYPKDTGKILLSIHKRTGAMLVHLGSQVEKRDSRLVHVASTFRDECGQLKVSYTEQSEKTRCSIDLKGLGTASEEFQALIVRTLRDADAALKAASSVS